MAPEIPTMRWRALYVAAVLYGALTVVVLWLFTRAYTYR